MTDSMRAVVVTALGGSDVLQVQDREIPEPGPGQLLVKVAAAGVNFRDVYQRQGIYPTPTPFVLGVEGAGEVVSVGADVSSAGIGDVVAWASADASAAEYVVVAAANAAPVPEGVPAEVAAAAMLQGMTAHFLVNSTYPVQSGDVVLVHAAAGGVGQLLVQLAKAKGAVVIGTVGSAAKATKARDAGADEVIRYDTVEDVSAEVRRFVPDGLPVVYDGVGKATFEASLASLTKRGMLVLFGASSGQVPPFNPQRLQAAGSVYLTRPTMAHYLRTRDELLWRAGDVLSAVADGSLRVEVGGRYPFTEAARAYDDLEGRRTTGKLLLLP